MLLARHVPVKLLLSLQVSVSICWCAHETLPATEEKRAEAGQGQKNHGRGRVI